MLSWVFSDGHSRRYSKAADGGGSPELREAAMLFSVAENHLSQQAPDEAFKTAQEAAAKFRAIKDEEGVADCLRITTKVLRFRGQLADAEAKVRDELRRMEKERAPATACAKLKLALAEVLMFSGRTGDKGRFDEAKELSESALESFRAADEDSMLTLAKLELAKVLSMQSEQDPSVSSRAIEVAEEVVEYYRRNQIKRGLPQALHTLAMARSQQVGDVEAHAAGALDATLEALQIFRILEDQQSVALELQFAARQYLRLKRPTEALTAAQESADLLQAMTLDSSYEAESLEAVVTANLELGQYEAAETVASEAFKRFRWKGAVAGEAAMLQSLLFVHLLAGNMEAATSVAEEARTAAKQAGNREQEVLILQVMASMSMEQQDPAKAVACAEDASKRYDAQFEQPGFVPALENVTSMQVASQKHEEAIQGATDARSAFKASGKKEGEATSLLRKSHAQLADGQLEQALESAVEAKQILLQADDIKGVANASRRIARVYMAMKSFGKAMIEANEAADLLESRCPKAKQELVALWLLSAEAQIDEVMASSTVVQTKSPAFASAYLKARSLTLKATELARDMADEQLLASTLLFGAHLHTFAMRIGDALELIREAWHYFRRTGNIVGEVEALVARSNAHLLAGRSEKARSIAEDALRLSRRSGDKESEAMCHEALERIRCFSAASDVQEKLEAELKIANSEKVIRSYSPPEEADPSEADLEQSRALIHHTRALSRELVRSLVCKAGTQLAQEVPNAHKACFTDAFSRKYPLIIPPAVELASDSTTLAAAAYIRSRKK